MAFSYLDIHSLTISLIVLVFIFSLVMLIIFLLDNKVYLGMWVGGLSLFLANIILLMSITHGYRNEILILLQRICSSLGALLMVQGCMKLLNKKINSNMIVFLCFDIIVSANYALGLIPNSLVLFIHFSFLTSINVYAAIELTKSKLLIIFNKYVLAAIFLIWGMSYTIKFIAFAIKLDLKVWGFLSTFLIVSFFLVYAIFALYRQKTNLLYEKEVCFDDTFNYSAVGMAIIGLDCKIISVNQSLSKILGYSSDEFKVIRLEDITFEDDIETSYVLVEELLAGEKNSFQVEKRYINQKGDTVWAIVNVSLIRDKKNRPLYFVLQVQDVTSYKTLQNELIKSNEKYKTLLNSYDNSIAVFDSGVSIIL